MLHFVTAVVDVLEGGCDHVHVVVGICAAADAEAEEVVSAEAVFARHGITVGEQIADFATADTGLAVKLYGEHLGGKLLLGDLVEHLVGVDEEGVAADGTLIRNAVFVELGGEIFHLLDAGLEHVELGVLVEADSESGHVAAVHTAIGKEALEGDEEAFRSFIDIFPAGSDETAHVDETVFLRRHRHSVGEVEHLAADLLDSCVFELRLAHLDEVCVLGEAG